MPPSWAARSYLAKLLCAWKTFFYCEDLKTAEHSPCSDGTVPGHVLADWNAYSLFHDLKFTFRYVFLAQGYKIHLSKKEMDKPQGTPT